MSRLCRLCRDVAKQYFLCIGLACAFFLLSSSMLSATDPNIPPACVPEDCLAGCSCDSCGGCGNAGECCVRSNGKSSCCTDSSCCGDTCRDSTQGCCDTINGKVPFSSASECCTWNGPVAKCTTPLSKPTVSVSVDRAGPLVVCKGDTTQAPLHFSVTASGKPDSTSCYAISSPTWTWTGDASGAAASADVTIDTSTSGARDYTGTAKVRYDCNPLRPGDCTCPSSYVESDPVSKKVNVTVVEVASLTSDGGSEFDDGDNDTNTKAYWLPVASSGNITVTATPNPAVTEANLPACWTLAGGTGSGKLTRTVDKTTPGKTEITCTAGTSSKKTTIWVVKAEIKKVVFTSDHGVLTDWNTNYAGSGGTVYNPRGWENGGANNPITHTKDTKISLTVTVKVQPAGLAFDLTGTGPHGYDTFPKKGAPPSTAADQTVNVTANDALPKQISVLNESINWTITKGTTQCCATSSGPHKMYVIWGGPGAGPTLKRMDWCAEHAKGQDTLPKIGDAIGPDATGGGRFGSGSIFGSPPSLTTAWQVMDGSKGDCGTLSTLMKYELDMLGATGAEVRFVFARHANWTGLSKAGPPALSDLESDGDGNVLGIWFGGGLGKGWNYYEGCCVFQSQWWEGGRGQSQTSAYNVLRDVADPNTSGADNSHQCWLNNTSTAVSYPPGTP